MSRSLHRQTWGSGPSTAVLLHGSTSSSRTWWRIGPWLAKQGWTAIALDLPSHGRSPAAGEPLTPNLVAEHVAAELVGESVDLLIGHSFGAAVALTLTLQRHAPVTRLVLEELPGPRSVDWSAEADAVLTGRGDARRERDNAHQHVRRSQPRWHERDCEYAVDDLARCHAPDVAAGLAQGPHWLPVASWQSALKNALLVLAPDAAGVNRLGDATALRGTDREAATTAAARTVTVNAGHCIHRDDPRAWQTATATQLGT